MIIKTIIKWNKTWKQYMLNKWKLKMCDKVIKHSGINLYTGVCHLNNRSLNSVPYSCAGCPYGK